MNYDFFDKRQNRAFNKKHPFTADKLYYNSEHDHYICAMSHKWLIGNRKRKRQQLGLSRLEGYQARNCQSCPLNGNCHKSQEDCLIQVNVNPERQKQKADALLKSEEGIAKRKKHCWDVEPVFDNIKANPWLP